MFNVLGKTGLGTTRFEIKTTDPASYTIAHRCSTCCSTLISTHVQRLFNILRNLFNISLDPTSVPGVELIERILTNLLGVDPAHRHALRKPPLEFLELLAGLQAPT